MVAHVETVAFQGMEARAVDVQVQMTSGLPAFTIVGLPDKAVAESRERVRAALSAIGLGLPPKRITVNLAPADLPKEGSHFDLPIAIGLLQVMGVIEGQDVDRYVALGELSLDGTISQIAGVLPAAVAANGRGKGLICPKACGPEAAWAGFSAQTAGVLAPENLIQLVNHLKGTQLQSEPKPVVRETSPVSLPDLKDIKGQESAKRALEIAATGGHNMLMVGPPGAGKSMLASRLPGILPPLSSLEMLEVSMVASMAGTLSGGELTLARPFRAPHHSASMAALIGGGLRVRPGEVSLAHHGVLFLDELPEFPRPVIDSLRQPIETGEAVIARANAHVSYPARFQLIAAMNPCRCGYAGDASKACARVPKCVGDYQSKLSGPLLDRFDVRIDVPAVSVADLAGARPQEGSTEVAARVMQARALQLARNRDVLGRTQTGKTSAAGSIIDTDTACLNARLEGEALEEVASLDAAGSALMLQAADKMGLTARGYHRVLKVARTLADLERSEKVHKSHLAEALSYRGLTPGALGKVA